MSNKKFLKLTSIIFIVTSLLSGATPAISADAPAEEIPVERCIERPSVTGLSPSSGSARGGTLVSITGTCFDRRTTVAFGEDVYEVTVVSATLIRVVTKEHAEEAVDVSVTFDGERPIVLEKAFTFRNSEELTLTYDGNGNTKGTAPVDEKRYTSGEMARVLEPGDLDKEGFTFATWNTDPDPKVGKSYRPGEEIEMLNDTVLYAMWEAIPPPPITHTVTYALGGGTGTLPTQAPVAEGSTFIVASAAGITRTGYTFNNWSNGTTGFAPGASYTMGTSNVVLTATWTLIPPTTYTVTYALGGGTGTLPTQTPVAAGATFVVASSAGITRDGYTFSKWSDGTTEYAAGATYTMGTANIVLTATWTLIPPTTYTVTYALGGGTGTLPTQAPLAAGATFTVASATTIARSGFTFNKWSDGTA